MYVAAFVNADKDGVDIRDAGLYKTEAEAASYLSAQPKHFGYLPVAQHIFYSPWVLRFDQINPNTGRYEATSMQDAFPEADPLLLAFEWYNVVCDQLTAEQRFPPEGTLLAETGDEPCPQKNEPNQGKSPDFPEAEALSPKNGGLESPEPEL